MTAPARSVAADKLYFGVYTATVSEIADSKHPGEVRLKFDWFDPKMQTEWCRVCNLYAGDGYGTFFHPEKDDEVLVAFIKGDMRQPIVLGGLYNGKDKPPTARTQDKDEKMIRTRTGHRIILDDTSGNEKIVIVDKTGKNSIVIDAAANSITVTAEGRLVLKGKGVEISSGAEMKIEAKGTLDVIGKAINLN